MLKVQKLVAIAQIEEGLPHSFDLGNNQTWDGGSKRHDVSFLDGIIDSRTAAAATGSVSASAR